MTNYRGFTLFSQQTISSGNQTFQILGNSNDNNVKFRLWIDALLDHIKLSGLFSQIINDGVHIRAITLNEDIPEYESDANFISTYGYNPILAAYASGGGYLVTSIDIDEQFNSYFHPQNSLFINAPSTISVHMKWDELAAIEPNTVLSDLSGSDNILTSQRVFNHELIHALNSRRYALEDSGFQGKNPYEEQITTFFSNFLDLTLGITLKERAAYAPVDGQSISSVNYLIGSSVEEYQFIDNNFSPIFAFGDGTFINKTYYQGSPVGVKAGAEIVEILYYGEALNEDKISQIMGSSAVADQSIISKIKGIITDIRFNDVGWSYNPEAIYTLSAERFTDVRTNLGLPLLDIEGPRGDAQDNSGFIDIRARSEGIFGLSFLGEDRRSLLIGSAGWVGTSSPTANFALTAKDRLTGGDDDDILVSMSISNGNELFGEDGNDILIGSNQSDHISGGDDHDALIGRDGADVLTGESGRDRLDGGAGIDSLSGGDGDDRLIADFDDLGDLLDGGAGAADTAVYQYGGVNGKIELGLASENTETNQTGPSKLGHFGLSIDRGSGQTGSGADVLSRIERAAVEAGSGIDTFIVVKDGVDVDASLIDYIDLGGHGSGISGGFDVIAAADWDNSVSIDLSDNEFSWKIFEALPWSGGLNATTITVRNAEVAIGGNGDDFLRAGNSVGSVYVLDGGEGNDEIFGRKGNDTIVGGAGDDTIFTGSGHNVVTDLVGNNLIYTRGTLDEVELGDSSTWIDLGSNTVIQGADLDDRLSRFGIGLYGGVQQWWNETGIAVWSPYLSLLSAFPFVGAQALISVAAIQADIQFMKFAKYRVDAETGDAVISLNWGLGGSAVVKDWDIDLNTGRGDAGLTLFRQGKVKSGANSAIKASNGVDQYVNLALYAGFGLGLPGFDPLVLDLDGNGYDLIGQENSQAYFEFDNDGFAENAGWIGGNDAFLARDLNGNGTIDDITELFGNRSMSGFAALAALDSNADGVINSADSAFDTMRLWKDANSNAVTDAGELVTLASAGIASISLASVALDPQDPEATVRGNSIVREGSFTRTDGTIGSVGDVALVVSDTDTRWTGSLTTSQAAQALPQVAGIGELKNLRLAMTGDATLLSLVNAFASNAAGSVTALRGEAEAILYRWAGVDGTATTAIGGNGFDTRKLAFLEKYVGIQLMPRDTNGALILNGLPQIEALWQHEFNQLAFKLIAQGPLAAQFAGLSYLESADQFRAAGANTVSTILATFLDQMPTGTAAAQSYWADWGPLLGAFAGTVMRSSGIDVGKDYFFGELVKALDSRTLPLTLQQLAAGLAVDGVKIAGSSGLTRTAQDDGTLVYFSTTGSQNYIGGIGQDAYVFGRTIGNAVITDIDSVENGDRIRFAFLNPDDVMMARDGHDLLITVTATGETVRVVGQFAPVVAIKADYLLSSNKGVEDIQFADGTIYETSDIAIGVGKGTAGADSLTGTMHSDVLQGLAGNDILMGGDDADIYVVNGNEGHDIVRDIQTTINLPAMDILIFGENVSPDDLVFARAGAQGDDLLVTIGTAGNSLLIEGQFGYSSLGYNSSLATNQRIEGISLRHFGEAWSSKDIENLLIEQNTTGGNDVTRGFGNNDYFKLTAGNDLLLGMDGGDVYEFGIGAGHDAIDEDARYIDASVSLSGLAIGTGNDVVRFMGSITLGSVQFSRLSAAPDLTITITATGETLTVKGQFDGFQTGVFDAQWFDRIERFEFSDGTVLNWQQVLALTTVGTSGSDQLWGDLYADVMIGGLGNDTLSGGGKGDEYRFNLGDGQDIVFDNNQALLGTGILTPDTTPDFIAFGEGITASTVTLARSGADFILGIGSNGDSIRLQGQDSLINTGVFGVFGPDRIEELRFFDGTVWTWQQLNTRWLTQNTTSGADTVLGFTLSDRFESSAGNDILSGGDSGDIYAVALGSGSDIIREGVVNTLYEDDDAIEFAAGILPSSVSISRAGDNLTLSLSDGSRVTIEGQFAFNGPYAWQDIEQFRFADGTTWTEGDIRTRLIAAASTSGADTIVGFNTTDVLDGGSGQDTLQGGNGSDTYHYGQGYGNDTVIESVTNSNLADADRVVFGTMLLPEHLAVSRTNDDLVLTIIATGETLTVRDQFSFSSWLAWNDVERFEFANGTVWTDLDIGRRLTGGTSGNDNIVGTFRSDTLDGGLGSDILQGGDGADIYVFGLGYGHDQIIETLTNANLSEDDELRFGAGISANDLSFVRVGNNLVITIAGSPQDSLTITGQFANSNRYLWNDIERFRFNDGSYITRFDIQAALLVGTSGNDTILGFVDDDRLDGGAGDDLLQGVDGADTYVYGVGYGHDRIVETVTNANFSDNDKLELVGGVLPSNASFDRIGDDLRITLATGETLTITKQFVDSTNEGVTFEDVETIIFSDGTIWDKGAIAQATFKPTAGNDTIVGTRQAHTMSGLAGDDVLRAAHGNDILDGGLGNDLLFGQGGDDIYRFASGDGQDTIRESFFYDGGGFDRIEFGSGIAASGVSISQTDNGNDLTISFSGTSDGIVIDNGAYSDDAIEEIRFADGTVWNAATIFQIATTPTIGPDSIYGSNANDLLQGLAGDDRLFGNHGNDILAGGVGSDLLVGNNGDDIYRFAIGDGADTVRDYTSYVGSYYGYDAIEFAAGISPSQIAVFYQDGGRDFTLTIDGTGDVVTLDDTVATSEHRIEEVRFADGTIWTHADLLARVAAFTLGPDNITGSSGADNLRGGLGDDVISALGGQDILSGDEGNDTLLGGDSNDLFNVSGSSHGFDVFDGGVGTDTIRAMSNNTVIGIVSLTSIESVTANGFSNVSILGSDAANIIDVAITGITQIDGGGGNDTIGGTSNNDILRGGSGNDVLTGRNGVDDLFGDDGDDFFEYANVTNGVDRVNGGAGFDTIRAIANSAVIGLHMLSDIEAITAGSFTGVTVRLTTSSDSISFSGVTISGIGSISGDGGDDVIVGSSGNDVINGDGGNDTIEGGLGNDTIVGSVGTDTASYAGAASAVTVNLLTTTAQNTFGAGTDTLANIENLIGSSANDTFTGNTGGNILNGGAGNDALDGGAGNDTLIGGLGNDSLNGGTDIDTASYADAASAVTLSLALTSAQDTLGAGMDTLASIENLIGSAFDDTMTGSTAANILTGGVGNDVISAGDGNDSLDGGDGNDTLNGGTGTDGVSYASATATVTVDLAVSTGQDTGGSGTDILDSIESATGSAFADTLSGSSVANVLTGGLGADTLDGRAGNDTINGDDGDDLLVGGAGADILKGGAGTDAASYAGMSSAFGSPTIIQDTLLINGVLIDLKLATSTNGTTAPTSANLAKQGDAAGDWFYQVENLTGSQFRDAITGSDGANMLAGGDEADSLRGGLGDDSLLGEAGDDQLTGGVGNDMINGGLGADVANFAGLRSSYSIATNNGTLQVVDNDATTDGNDGTDSLIGVETAKFKNGETVSVTSPIILDLDGNGVQTFSANQSGALYDLDGDGLADDTSWFGRTEAMLFLDRNADGTVTNAAEFSFIGDREGARSDLEGLRSFDSNGDGILSALDVRFADFKLWQDRDSDGAVDEGEVLSFATAGVRSIDLAATAVNATTEIGDVAVLNRGNFTRMNGTTMEYLDAALTYFSASANVPTLVQQIERFDRRSSKYRVAFADGSMAVSPKSAHGPLDPRAGQLSAAAVLTFSNMTVGMLSPIILDLDGDGIEMRSIKKSKATFDMNGDGVLDDAGWAGKGDGFLVIDRNNDGKISSASELSFASEDSGALSDLAALSKLDSNNDGLLDDRDARFDELKIWVDGNGNGVTDSGELGSLAAHGISSIGLSARHLQGTAKVGENVLLSTATFTRTNGSVGTIGNAALAYRPGNSLLAASASRVPASVPADGYDFPERIDDGTGAIDADRLVAQLRQGFSSDRWSTVQPLSVLSEWPSETPGDIRAEDGAMIAPFDSVHTARGTRAQVIEPGDHGQADAVLARMVQDMGAFGAGSFGSANSPIRDSTQRPVELYA